jgi:hypothetical protein
MGHAVNEGFLKREHGAMVAGSSSPAALLDMLAADRAPAVEKWIERAAT